MTLALLGQRSMKRQRGGAGQPIFGEIGIAANNCLQHLSRPAVLGWVNCSVRACAKM